MENRLKGIGASSGLGVGKAIWWKSAKPKMIEKEIISIEEEQKRLDDAIRTAIQQIMELREITSQKIGKVEAEVFDAHLTFLTDPEYTGKMKKLIEKEQKNAEFICDQVTQSTCKMLSSLENEYMRARADDVRDIGNRLLLILSGETPFDPARLKTGDIVVAEELTPSETAQFPTELSGMITAKGSKTAHAAIIARTLGIPTIVGLGEAIHQIKNKDRLIIDGAKGEVFVNPSKDREKAVATRIANQQKRRKKALQEAAQDTHTKDGKRIQVFANIGNLNDIQHALDHHAEGVGLFRTEFLYLENNDWPTEEEQYEAYSEVLKAFGDRPVIIRTLDIGGDKELPYAKLPKEENPFLGHRAIRFCLDHPEIFSTQLKALLRASVYGNLWIMLPMIENRSEIKATKELLKKCQQELTQRKLPFREKIPLGIMIEIPAAAIISDILAQEVDFMSIGTNDLTQYTLATDRGNEKVAHLYDAAHPAILRLIQMTAQAAKKEGLQVGICGELAGDPELTEVLIGLGIHELSMSAPAIPETKQKIRHIQTDSAQQLSHQVLELEDGQQVRDYLRHKSVNFLDG